MTIEFLFKPWFPYSQFSNKLHVNIVISKGRAVGASEKQKLDHLSWDRFREDIHCDDANQTLHVRSNQVGNITCLN